jgi:hypothetical protein
MKRLTRTEINSESEVNLFFTVRIFLLLLTLSHFNHRKKLSSSSQVPHAIAAPLDLRLSL